MPVPGITASNPTANDAGIDDCIIVDNNNNPIADNGKRLLTYKACQNPLVYSEGDTIYLDAGTTNSSVRTITTRDGYNYIKFSGTRGTYNEYDWNGVLLDQIVLNVGSETPEDGHIEYYQPGKYFTANSGRSGVILLDDTDAPQTIINQFFDDFGFDHDLGLLFLTHNVGVAWFLKAYDPNDSFNQVASIELTALTGWTDLFSERKPFGVAPKNGIIYFNRWPSPNRGYTKYNYNTGLIEEQQTWDSGLDPAPTSRFNNFLSIEMQNYFTRYYFEDSSSCGPSSSVTSPVGWTDRSTGIFYVGSGNEPSGTQTSLHHPFDGDICGFRISNTARYGKSRYTPPTSPKALDGNTVLQMDLESDFTESNGLTVVTTGSPSIETASPPGDYSGYTEFNTTDWFAVTVGSTDEDLGDSWTIEAYVRRRNTSDNNGKIFGYGPLSTSSQDTFITLLANNKFSFQYDNNVGTVPDDDLVIDSVEILEEEWYYISITCRPSGDDFEYTMHIDGRYVQASKFL